MNEADPSLQNTTNKSSTIVSTTNDTELDSTDILDGVENGKLLDDDLFATELTPVSDHVSKETIEPEPFFSNDENQDLKNVKTVKNKVMEMEGNVTVFGTGEGFLKKNFGKKIKKIFFLENF